MADGNNLPGSGDGQDVCSFFASIFSQRQSVERLLNWLRESQTTCTDTNCFDDINGLPGTEQGGPLSESSLLQGEDYGNEFEPLGLILWLVVGLLTIFAMNLNRGQNELRNELGINKGGRSIDSRSNNNRHQDDDHDLFRRRNNRDDDDRSAL